MSCIFTSLQCFASLMSASLIRSFPSLCTTLNSVACTQFDKLKANMLDISQQHITPHHTQDDEQIPTTADCDLKIKLYACIRHHQDIMA